MNQEPKCPRCQSENIYPDGDLWTCPNCFYEFELSETEQETASDVVLDSNKNVLQDGDSVIVIKELKVKGSTSGVKAGTKVKSIRLVESTDGHTIACKIDGIGAMYLKSEFVRKA